MGNFTDFGSVTAGATEDGVVAFFAQGSGFQFGIYRSDGDSLTVLTDTHSLVAGTDTPSGRSGAGPVV